MEIAIAFTVVAALWLIFRKWVAQRQAEIITQFVGGGPNLEQRAKGLEQWECSSASCF
ncbi:hypothetical protein [Arthrobacter sp. NPDC093139]|uniref:hypothetical protein n=1 Tax=Arthrobacter sp. NPDC093139 TaxID=3363945 RepID=UPI00381D94ED